MEELKKVRHDKQKNHINTSSIINSVRHDHKTYVSFLYDLLSEEDFLTMNADFFSPRTIREQRLTIEFEGPFNEQRKSKIS